jgi:hypothetical protein
VRDHNNPCPKEVYVRNNDLFCRGAWRGYWPAFHRLAISLILMGLACALSQAVQKDKKTKLDTNNPYATAENEAPPPVKADDLAYRVILFEQFGIPQEYVADASKDVENTRSEAMSRLVKTGAFTRVESTGGSPGGDPFLLIKGVLLDHKIVSTAGRVFGGALGGSSRIAYWVKVFDGASGALLDELDLTTENSSFAAAWTFGATDRDLPFFLGRVLADYLALRARKDKGLSQYPLWRGSAVPDLAVFTDQATQLTWAVKDNRETVTWERAVQFAKEFRGNALSDWRLPTEDELKSLFNKANSTTVLFETVYCADPIRLSSYLYWTSESQGDKAKVFDFRKGKASFQKKKDYTYMRTLVVRK